MASGTKMSVEAWIGAGLAALRRDGFRAVKADSLAKALKVTRGSFYWHFPEVGSFQKAVIARWTEETLAATDTELGRNEGAHDPRHVLRQALTEGAARERVMRLWAIEEPMAAEAMAEIDGRRLAMLERLALAGGLDAATVNRRLMLVHLTLTGAMVLESHGEGGPEALVEELARLLSPSAPAEQPVIVAASAEASVVKAKARPRKAVVEETNCGPKAQPVKPKPAPKPELQQGLFDF